MSDSIHFKCSPSYFKVALGCSMSIPSDNEAVEEQNSAASQGTLQHEYLCYLLSKHFNKPIDEFDSSVLSQDEIDEVNDVYNKALEEYETLKKRYARVDVLLEEKVSLDSYIEGCFGFVDICFIGRRAKPNPKTKLFEGTTISVLDAKFGRVEVESIDDGHLNPQLTGYWCGIYDSIKDKHNVTRGCITILQPKLVKFPKYSAKASVFLDYMASEIAPAINLALSGKGKYNPSYENCKYCKNNKHCKFYNILALSQLQMLENPNMLSDEFIQDHILPNIPMMKKYCDNLWNYCVLKSELNGKKWKGFTLGTSRPTRVFIDDSVVKDIALTNKIEGLVVEEVVSPAQAEKILGKKKFTDLLADQVTYKPGKVTLVPEKPTAKASKKDLINDFNGGKE